MNYLLFLSLIMIFIIILYSVKGTINFFQNLPNLSNLSNLKIRYCVIDSKKRTHLVDKLEKDLGLTLERWPAVWAESCPHFKSYSKNKHRECITCRGLIIAHKEIWYDFLNSDADYVCIFEDDAMIESPRILEKLKNKFNNITSDITYLGHCHNYLCNHAYILNKKAAKIFYKEVQTCKHALDEQIYEIITKYKKSKVKEDILTAEYTKNKGEKKHWTNGLIHQSGLTQDDSLQNYTKLIK